MAVSYTTQTPVKPTPQAFGYLASNRPQDEKISCSVCCLSGVYPLDLLGCHISVEEIIDGHHLSYGCVVLSVAFGFPALGTQSSLIVLQDGYEFEDSVPFSNLTVTAIHSV
ncbi:hypothetical protein ALQ60_200108 [Pseudomonas syringae pv. papulans]|nr:hypothetical protein ALQ60_200108 [Pseudomonas syringae pv. papulans]